MALDHHRQLPPPAVIHEGVASAVKVRDLLAPCQSFSTRVGYHFDTSFGSRVRRGRALHIHNLYRRGLMGEVQRMRDCVFWDIAERRRPASFAYEDSAVMATMALHPHNPGAYACPSETKRRFPERSRFRIGNPDVGDHASFATSATRVRLTLRRCPSSVEGRRDHGPDDRAPPPSYHSACRQRFRRLEPSVAVAALASRIRRRHGSDQEKTRRRGLRSLRTVC